MAMAKKAAAKKPTGTANYRGSGMSAQQYMEKTDAKMSKTRNKLNQVGKAAGGRPLRRGEEGFVKAPKKDTAALKEQQVLLKKLRTLRRKSLQAGTATHNEFLRNTKRFLDADPTPGRAPGR